MGSFCWKVMFRLYRAIRVFEEPLVATKCLIVRWHCAARARCLTCSSCWLPSVLCRDCQSPPGCFPRCHRDTSKFRNQLTTTMSRRCRACVLLAVS